MAVALSRSPSAVTGLWIPGVSTNTSCTSGRFTTARTWVRVVCGLSDTMLTFWPTSAFSSVDLPTLGRPASVTKPERMARGSAGGRGVARRAGCRVVAAGTGFVASRPRLSPTA